MTHKGLRVIKPQHNQKASVGGGLGLGGGGVDQNS